MTDKPMPSKEPESLRILFAEDNAPDAELALLFLRNAGFDLTVDVVETEEAFLSKVNGHSYDLILSDYRLRDWTGKRALEIVKQQSPDVPFILVTGTLGDETAVEIMKMGAADYVLKDRLSRLPVALRRALDDRLLRRERQRGEVEIRRLNVELEDRVRARTAELEAVNKRLEKEISERLRIEKESDRFFSLALDMLCIAGFDGYFKRVNPAWNKVLGFTAEELLSQPYMDFIHPDDLERTRAEASKIATGVQTLSFENRYRCKDGSYRWMLWNAAPDAGQQVIYAIARDITDRKLVEEELLSAKQEAERNSRFKDRFLSTMSHELRTPLNAVLGFSDLLRDGRFGPLNDRQRRYLDHINTGGKHLLRLINDILDLSKIEAGRLELVFEEVDVNSIFLEIASVLAPLAEKKTLHLSHACDAGVTARADAMRLKQILINLAGNAIKFTPAGGRVVINALSHGKEIVLEVRDTGPGISHENQSRIFEAFQRLRDSSEETEGTGLGLAIAKRLVDMHGAKLELESELGHGCRFFFSLASGHPLRSRLMEIAAARPREGEEVRVLVIEDDPLAAQLIKSQIGTAGYVVKTCTEPQHALRVATEFKPHAITLDILMQPMTGWEVLTHLKGHPATCEIPVIVVSVVDQPAMGMTLGAEEYLMKPVDRHVLVNSLKRHLGPLAPGGTPLSILVVEDDATMREVLTEMLSKEGFAVSSAADGAEARHCIQKDLPNLVILDLILPHVSGMELLAEWRAEPRTADLPVFILTSKDLDRKEEEFLRENARSLLHKQEPWQARLLAKLRQVVPQSQLTHP